jgi:hypothetical protein
MGWKVIEKGGAPRLSLPDLADPRSGLRSVGILACGEGGTHGRWSERFA